MLQSCFKQPAPFYANSTSYQLSKPDVGFIEGECAKKVRVSLWLQAQGSAKGTILLQPGRTEPIEKHIESVSDFFLIFEWKVFYEMEIAIFLIKNTYFRKLIKFFPTARIIKTYWLFSTGFRLLI